MATKISDHVHWFPPGPPDRPSLCAVVGERRTVLLDAGSSAHHTREFLDGLDTRPDAVVYTHSHWDHVLGGAEAEAVIIAHRLTADALRELAARDWSDEGLAGGRYSEHITEELPSPRHVVVAQADVIFGDDGLDLDLGGVTVRVRHVGGDHCADACVMLVEPDGILFVGDCLCASPDGAMTAAKALPLCDAILAFDAERYVEGHHPAVTSRVEMEEYIEKIRHAARGGDAKEDDEDSVEVVEAFRAARVRIQPWSSGDRHVLDQALGDPAMTEHLGGPEPAEKIAKRQARYEQPGSGQYKIVVGGDDAGWVGYWDRPLGGDDVVYEVGWAVLPAFQGNGAASAATAELIALLRADSEHRYVHAYPNVENGPSNGICRKLGFTLLGDSEFEYPPGNLMRCNDWRLEL